MADVMLDDPNRLLNLTNAVCGYGEECGVGRFAFITTASFLATIGAGFNIILAYVFAFHQFPTTPPTLYPTILAILDTLICTFYVLFFGVDIVAIFLRIETLFLIYHSYILPLFVFSKCVQLAIPYMLICCTIERYAWIDDSKKISSFCLFTSKSGRFICIFVCFSICILMRVPSVLAFDIEVFAGCEDFFRSLAVSYKPWVEESGWFKTYEFQLVSICQVLFPFVVLVVLNRVIVVKLSSVDVLKKNYQLDIRMSKEEGGSIKAIKRALKSPITSTAVKDAVMSTVIIVTSYLLCSGLHLILTAMEQVDSELLKSEDDSTKASTFYTILGDIISFFYMFTSTIRVLIYCKCNPAIRLAILNTLKMKKFKNLNKPSARTPVDYNEYSNISL